VGGKPWKIRTRSRGLQQQQITVRGYRPREYLTEREIERLMEAARVNRHGHRDSTAIPLGLSPRLRARIRHRVRRGKKQGGSGEPPCCCVGERPQACSCDSAVHGVHLNTAKALGLDVPPTLLGGLMRSVFLPPDWSKKRRDRFETVTGFQVTESPSEAALFFG
jgi:hypothetical protein